MFAIFNMLPFLFRLSRFLVAYIIFMYVTLIFCNPEAAHNVYTAVFDYLWDYFEISERFWSLFPNPFRIHVVLLGALRVPEFCILDSGATHNVAFELLPGDKYQSIAKVTLADGTKGDASISAFNEVILDADSKDF